MCHRAGWGLGDQDLEVVCSYLSIKYGNNGTAEPPVFDNVRLEAFLADHPRDVDFFVPVVKGRSSRHCVYFPFTGWGVPAELGEADGPDSAPCVRSPCACRTAVPNGSIGTGTPGPRDIPGTVCKPQHQAFGVQTTYTPTPPPTAMLWDSEVADLPLRATQRPVTI